MTNPIMLDQMLPAFEEMLTTAAHPLRTGVAELDRLVEFRPGELILLAGRSGSGKTTLALNVLLLLMRQAPDLRALLWSGEIDAAKVWAKTLAIASGVGVGDVFAAYRRGALPAEIYQARETLRREFGARLAIVDTPMTAAGAVEAAKQIEAGLVIVDYVQLLTPPKGAQNREQEVARSAHTLREGAKSLRAVVIALSQLNRAADELARRGKQPGIAQLRESGALEQEASIILILDNNDAEPAVGARVAKNRFGRTGAMPLQWIWPGGRVEFRPADSLAVPTAKKSKKLTGTQAELIMGIPSYDDDNLLPPE